MDDKGIFEELAPRVRLRHPSWLRRGPAVVLHDPGSRHRYAIVHREPVAFAVGGEGPLVPAASAGSSDADADGIPDGLDILVGAKKAVLNGAHYKSAYSSLGYPNGDVPRSEGVCTDVIIRSLRNAGFDLQKLVAEDIANHPARYPMVKKPDPNIDQRRVRTLLPYFQAHWRAVSTDTSVEPLLPGDVCFMDTMRDSEPEHMGIVSDRLGPSGLPLVINNWNDGTKTSEMDLLSFVPITHRFRSPGALQVSPEARGLSGLLARRGLSLDEPHRQLVLVTVATWDSTGGKLRRYDRRPDGTLEQVGRVIPIRVGSGGVGRGRGMHDSKALRGLAPKREGDRKAPAGVFAFGTAFGPLASPPYSPANWPWRGVESRDRFVDDPGSEFYNTWQQVPEDGRPSWTSAEKLSMYRLGLVVKHNSDPVKPGAGSAIFLHTWKTPESTTLGCTAMPHAALEELLAWLEPSAQPIIVQVAGSML